MKDIEEPDENRKVFDLPKPFYTREVDNSGFNPGMTPDHIVRDHTKAVKRKNSKAVLPDQISKIDSISNVIKRLGDEFVATEDLIEIGRAHV